MVALTGNNIRLSLGYRHYFRGIEAYIKKVPLHGKLLRIECCGYVLTMGQKVSLLRVTFAGRACQW